MMNATPATGEVTLRPAEPADAADCAQIVFDALGALHDHQATRMKCALLGLKIVKSATLGDAADWVDEGEPGDPLEAATL
jgi:hypothetical protein